MKSLSIKLFLFIFSLLLLFFIAPGEVKAYGPPTSGKILTKTGAPVAGVWVKWTDSIGDIQYAKTDANGDYFFQSWDYLGYSQMLAMTKTPIDTNLDGKNDTFQAVLTFTLDTDTSHDLIFDCGEDPQKFTAIVPTSMNGNFSTVTVTINNGTQTIVVPNITFNGNPGPPPPPPPPPPPAAGKSITNLNFGISNTYPWFQSGCGDIRVDNGISDNLPLGFTAIATDATCSTPGLAFTGDTDINTGQGTVSTSGQTVGGSSYPEVYSSSTPLQTSYASLLAKAQNASITPTNLSSVCTLSNCTLPNNLAHGIYLANGDVTLNAANKLKNNSDYIFLINGNLTLNGTVTVPNGSTALFSTSKNIIVAAAVGSPVNCNCSSIAGWFVAGQNFIVNSAGNCNDQRLNVTGAVVINASGNGGTFQNNRDLCAGDLTDPTVTFQQRLDMIFNAPQFLQQQQTISQEIAP